MAKSIEQLSLMDISPPSITCDKKVKDLITAIDPELLNVSEAISEAFIISRIKELPEAVLDLLAWQWHVDFYELAKGIDAKRDMVLKSISWHRKKGTRKAILEALEMLGVEAKFTSWQDLQEEGAQPYTFVIDAKLTSDFWERVDWTKPTQTLRRAIQESKAARSYMSRLYVYMESSSEHDIAVGIGSFSGVQHEIKINQKTAADSQNSIVTALAAFSGVHHRIKAVQGTKAKTAYNLYLGTGTFLTALHEVDISQKTSSNTGQKISVGLGAFSGVCHEIKIEWHTSAETGSKFHVGAGAFQGVQHRIPTVQKDRADTNSKIHVGTGIFQSVYYKIGIASKKSSANFNFGIGTGASSGKHYELSIAPREAGAVLNIDIGIGNSSGIAQSTGILHSLKQRLSAGTVISQGTHYEIGIAPNESGTALNLDIGTGTSKGIIQAIGVHYTPNLKHKISAGGAVSHGTHYEIGVIAPEKAGSVLNIEAGIGTSRDITHKIGVHNSSNLAQKVLTGGAISHGAHYKIGVAPKEGDAVLNLDLGAETSAGISQTIGIHHSLKQKVSTGSVISQGIYIENSERK